MIPTVSAPMPDGKQPLSLSQKQELALREAAIKLEASFLSEMLKSAGLDGQQGEFGGGLGETQFSSFLREAQAEQIARAGGVGLAEAIFASLKAGAADHDKG